MMDVCHKDDFECQHPNLNQHGHLQVGRCRTTNIFHKKHGISFLDCLKECMVTSQCKGVNYRSHWPLCDIVGLSEDFTPETDCVYTDISEWSKSIAGRCKDHPCNDGEKCVYDGEIQKCVTACNIFTWYVDGPIPKDCSDQVGKKSGVYTIFPKLNNSLIVFCDMDYQEGGWTSKEDLMAGKHLTGIGIHTKRGFGKPSGEYWIGDGARDHTGKSLHGMMFSTKDRDNDLIQSSCAIDKCSGWWHRSSTLGNINGKLQPGNRRDISMHWKPWRGWFSLQETTMMIKPLEK
ncbi:unnamed protein product [Mytilus edulis]|uniref:Fibrinogen C-terminal domain-containing protein n=1 Tax=Mytilus edulis TaxID=6550 RepID=A0A8S3Q579_MYTED|nr:unnamed protein product [Mytilus edulis]